MKGKYYQSLILLILLILTFISQYKVGFSVVPGWHSTIYPPKYIMQLKKVRLLLSGNWMRQKY